MQRVAVLSVCALVLGTAASAQQQIQASQFSITNYDFAGRGVFTSCTVANGCYFFGGYTSSNGCGLPSNVPIGQFGINGWRHDRGRLFLR